MRFFGHCFSIECGYKQASKTVAKAIFFQTCKAAAIPCGKRATLRKPKQEHMKGECKFYERSIENIKG